MTIICECKKCSVANGQFGIYEISREGNAICIRIVQQCMDGVHAIHLSPEVIRLLDATTKAFSETPETGGS